MQVLPLLTPLHFINNEKKRSRSDDDFESNCLKKRLISTCTPTTPPHEYEYDGYDIDNNNQVDHVRGRVTPPTYIDDDDLFSKNKTILDTNLKQFMELNGKNLYNNNHIPNFMLNSRSLQPEENEAQNQLVLYKPNPLLLPPLSPPTTPTITEIEDEEEDFEPMDLD